MNRRERLRAVFGADPDEVERLARALDAPQQTVTSDPAINGALAAAQALAPADYPREAWRAALKDRMLREAIRPPMAEDGAGSRDGMRDPTHVAEVVDPGVGRLILADLEAIDEDRVTQAVRSIAEHLSRQHPGP